jgi:molecular chaperone DnaJ
MNLEEAYSILELSPGVSQDEAKKRYREFTKKYHPDINKEPGSEDKFKKINEAYALIQKGPSKTSFNPFNRSSVVIPENINLAVTISFIESVLGCEKNFKFSRKIKCIKCNGHGEYPLNNGCVKCGGTGNIVFQKMHFIYSQTCDKCHGKVDTSSCDNCNCNGFIDSDASIKVTIPGGVRTGNILRLQRIGNFYGSFMDIDQITDANVNIIVIPEEGLSLVNNDVVSEIEVDLIDAIKGCKKTIKTIFGDKDIEIVPMSRNKDNIIIPNLGVNKTGNHIVTLDVKYSDKIIGIINSLEGTE